MYKLGRKREREKSWDILWREIVRWRTYTKNERTKKNEERTKNEDERRRMKNVERRTRNI